jgi:hypothetical protein
MWLVNDSWDAYVALAWADVDCGLRSLFWDLGSFLSA